MSVNPSGNRGMLTVAANLADVPGPNGPPSNVEEFTYQGGARYGYQWTNYDSSYYTDYSYDDGSTVEGQVGPGGTSIETGSTTPKTDFAVRHASGGLYSSWVGIE